MVWCLKVLIAHPDYKRPYAEAIVKHFNSKESAEKELLNVKLEFLERYWDIKKNEQEESREVNDFYKKMYEEEDRQHEHCEEDNDEYTKENRLENLEKIDEDLQDYIDNYYYSDSYMYMDPIEWDIFEVKPSD